MFSAYAKISENRYRETSGLDFEEFAVGQVFHHRPGLTLTQQENAEEAFDTYNAAMLHYDAHYAQQTEFGNPLVVSTLTMQKIIGMSWKTFARKDRITAFDDITMTAPVYGGDTLYCTSRITAIDDLNEEIGLVTVKASATNQHGTEVARLGYTISIFKKGKHPCVGKLENQQNDERFSAYRQLEDRSLIEVTGLFFESFIKGDVFEHRPQVTLQTSSMLRHVMQSTNWNPMYSDGTSAHRLYGTNECPASEVHTLSLITAATTRTFGRVVANLGWSDTKLSRHFFAGDRFCVESKVLAKRESKSRPDQGILTVQTTAYDQHGKHAISYTRTLLVYRERKGPYAAAGY
ncbi:MaoC family dehydratase [Pseudovibrio sp. Tun.PSC04-5.I4]|uniref:MaoC family dehydratase n=1 Tax=Pseudovibrio sp. Tun.PSC04-5.I4 TaxID=1798213 RepID=UPI0008846642|nr:MaoC family dehydratase [Pseudovibrio sp. Tun.PSC04-5.I4]SDR03226.1 itaconyl-CoA hydratase [Pseudovibrio sp. Tun.PSC04-5.I4]